MLSDLVMRMVVFLFACGLEWYVFGKFLDQLGKRRLEGKKYRLFLMLMVLLEMLYNVMGMGAYIKLTLVILSLYIFARKAYQLPRSKCVVSVSIFVIMLLLVEGVSTSAAMMIFSVSAPMDKAWSLEFQLSAILASRILVIGVYYMMNKIKSCHWEWQRETSYILILLITNILIMFFAFERMPECFEDRQYYLELFLVTLLVALANIVLVLLIIKMNKMKEIAQKLQHCEERIEQEYHYYQKIDRDYENIRLLYHDINNHLTCIKSLISQPEQLERYLEQLSNDLKLEGQIYQTGNSTIDTILKGKSLVCEQLGIRLVVSLNLKETDFVEDKDWCSILSNALDNAIEACQSIKTETIEPFIRLEGGRVHQFIVIKITNSKDKPIYEVRGKITSDKPDMEHHGFGLMSMKRSIQKYNGEMNMTYTEDTFKVKILIPIYSE